MKPTTRPTSVRSRTFKGLALVASALLLGVALFAAAIASAEDEALSAAQRGEISRGKLSFNVYCASCHGRDASGTGPMTQALRYEPRDLRRLAKRNDGVFPAAEVFQKIDGSEDVLGHGSGEMPVWGPTFQLQRDGGDARDVKSRIDELVAYLESIQDTGKGDAEQPKSEP